MLKLGIARPMTLCIFVIVMFHGAAAARYKSGISGMLCGAATVASKAECASAASELGLSGSSENFVTLIDSVDKPPGCFESLGGVYFNRYKPPQASCHNVTFRTAREESYCVAPYRDPGLVYASVSGSVEVTGYPGALPTRCYGGGSSSSSGSSNQLAALRVSGSCPNRISTLSQCSAEAQRLGLSDTTASMDEHASGVSYDPPGCYFENDELKFNAGANTGSCSVSDKCICGSSTPVLAPSCTIELCNVSTVRVKLSQASSYWVFDVYIDGAYAQPKDTSRECCAQHCQHLDPNHRIAEFGRLAPVPYTNKNQRTGSSQASGICQASGVFTAGPAGLALTSVIVNFTAPLVEPKCADLPSSPFLTNYFLRPNRLDGNIEIIGVLALLFVSMGPGMPVPSGGQVGRTVSLLWAICIALQALYSFLALLVYIMSGVSYMRQYSDCLSQWKYGNTWFGMIAVGTIGFQPLLLLYLFSFLGHVNVLARAGRAWQAATGASIRVDSDTIQTFEFACLAYSMFSFFAFYGCSLAIIFTIPFAGICFSWWFIIMVGVYVVVVVLPNSFHESDTEGDSSELPFLAVGLFLWSPLVTWGVTLALFVYAGSDFHHDGLGITNGAELIRAVYSLYFKEATFSDALALRWDPALHGVMWRWQFFLADGADALLTESQAKFTLVLVIGLVRLVLTVLAHCIHENMSLNVERIDKYAAALSSGAMGLASADDAPAKKKGKKKDKRRSSVIVRSGRSASTLTKRAMKIYHGWGGASVHRGGTKTDNDAGADVAAGEDLSTDQTDQSPAGTRARPRPKRLRRLPKAEAKSLTDKSVNHHNVVHLQAEPKSPPTFRRRISSSRQQHTESKSTAV